MISENISSFETHWNKFFKDWEEDNKGVFEKDKIWSGERKGSGKNKLEFDVFPQPYLGDFKNHSVITLNLNPSRSKNKPKQLEEFKKTKLEDFKKADNYYEYAKSFPTKELKFWQNQIKWIDGIFKNLKKDISSDVYPFAIEICPWCSESWQTLKMDDEIIQHLDTNVFRVIEQVIENSELKLVLSVGKAYYDIFNYDKKNFKKIDEITSKPFEEFYFSSNSPTYKELMDNNPQHFIPQNWPIRLVSRSFSIWERNKIKYLNVHSPSGGSNNPPGKIFDEILVNLINKHV